MACYLTIKSDPSGAEVRIDGSYKGTTTIYNILLYPGYYNIRIEKTGYVPYQHINYHISSSDLAKTLSVTLNPIVEPLNITDVDIDVYDDYAPQHVDFDIDWSGGEPPFEIKIDPGTGVAYIENTSRQYITRGHKYNYPGRYHWEIQVKDDFGNYALEDGYHTVGAPPPPPIWENHVIWESYSSEGGNWYLHVFYGTKLPDSFDAFVESTIPYITHPAGRQNQYLVSTTIPEGTPPGTYDAWTVISTESDPTKINDSNILAEKFDLNAISV